MLGVVFREVAIVLLVCQSVTEGKDLLHLFRPKPDLPQELNDFLTDVQHHRKDFAFIRNVAKNRRRYENSYKEHKILFAEDLNNQVTINPDYNSKRENELKDWMPRLRPNSYADDQGGFERSNGLRSYYPEERYSKFIHSPVRLRKKYEENALNQRVKVESNGNYGNVKRSQPRFPEGINDEKNRYHTGYVVGVADDDVDDEEDDDYYQDLRPSGKKKREVEISIKSDGKLVKHFEEDGNGPKSIILNIKSENSKAIESLMVSSTTLQAGLIVTSLQELTASSQQAAQNKNPLLSNPSGPSNSKTIPSLTNSNNNNNNALNPNTLQNQNVVGVPINAIPAAGISTINKNGVAAPSPSIPKKSGFDGLPEMAKVSNAGAFVKAKPLSSYYKPDYGYGDFKWSGESNHMAKSIDMAQNNVNSFDSVGEKQFGFDLDANDNKKDEFEKVQGLVMDSTSANNNKLNNQYRKRQSLDVLSNEGARGNQADKYLYAMDPIDDKTLDDYVHSLEEGVNEEQKQYPQSAHWETGDSQVHLDPNRSYEVIEKSTRDILILPVSSTATTVCVDKQRGEAEAIAEAIVDQMRMDEESSTECQEEEVEVQTDECGSTRAHQEIEIIHERGHHERPRHHPHHEGEKRRMHKRSNKEETSKKIVIIKKDKQHHNKLKGHHKNTKPHHLKREQAKNEAFRNRKHLPSMPKYKRKRVRQHPKKRIDRELEDEQQSLDFYDLNELYEDDAPQPFQSRQLKGAEYEFDPSVIQDVGDHYKEEIDKLEKKAGVKANDKGGNTKGVRKKFKSEGDYADEEDPITAGPSKKVAVKKTRNQFAFAPDATTEGNDDDYDYADMTDMEDEDEDIAYEEEDVRDDNLDLEEASGSFNKNEHESDRRVHEPANKLEQLEPGFGSTKAVATPNYSMNNIENVLMEANDLLAAAHAHGGGRGKKKDKKKKKPHSKQAGLVTPHETQRELNKKKRETKRKRRLNKSEIEAKSLGEDMTSSFHGRGLQHAHKAGKHKKIKLKRRQSEGNAPSAKQLQSSQQKEDIFLRYNPEFQRWPRFVQSDNRYHEQMRRRALDNQRRRLRNNHMVPMSNEYFVNPRPAAGLVKRDDETTTATSEATSEETVSTTATEVAGESSTTAAADAVAAAAATTSEADTTTSTTASEESSSAPSSTSAAEVTTLSLDVDATGTLPQAAQKILQTANSDIFDNTSAIGVVGGEGGNLAPEVSVTQFEFTTNADDLTENTQCETTIQINLTPCVEESASHSPVTITSVLPLIKEVVTKVGPKLSRDEFLDLNDILDGILPKLVVSESLSSARGGVRQGLRANKFNTNLKLSIRNTSGETSLILNEMTNLMMKLKYHSTCQMLPANLLTYIKVVTKNDMDDPMRKVKEMNEIDFDEHQSNYMFHTNQQGENLHEKAQVLKELLNKYNNLPSNCKERAEPVKEYIESHLAMAERMGGGAGAVAKVGTASTSSAWAALNANATAKPKTKKEINVEDKKLEGQMMEEGLKNQNADANEVIEDRQKKGKREAEDERLRFREISTSTSPEYGKLADAVRNERNRRQIIRTIGEIYGRSKREEVDKSGERYLPPRGAERGFESPQVINL